MASSDLYKRLLDTKKYLGKISEGKHGYIDTTFALLDQDFMALVSGKLNPKSALITVSLNLC